MSQQQQAFEAARTRIQKLVDEIAALSKKEMRSEEYFQQFLNRAVQSADAKGGAVWLVQQRSQDEKSEFQLAAQVEFESSLFHADEQQRGAILRTLATTVQGKKAIIFAPGKQEAPPGSLEAELQLPSPPTGEQNRTPYPFICVPLFLKDQVLGVLQVWLQPYVTPQNLPEFVSFFTSLSQHVENHVQSRRQGTLMVENQRLQHVLKFAGDVVGTLDSREIARLTAHYGRDLLGCERCSVLQRDGEEWRVISISGQEVVEPKSSMVKTMKSFVEAHVGPQLILLSKKELLARHAAPIEAEIIPKEGEPPQPPPAARTDAVDVAYFEQSHIMSGAIAPMMNANKEIMGAVFAESSTEDFFGSREAGGHTRLAEWLATHSGKALTAAWDHESLPLLKVTSRIRDTGRTLSGKKRNRTLLKMAITAAIIIGLCLFPKMDRVDGNCTLVPSQRLTIVPEVPGRVEKILVRENSKVKKGDPVAQLETQRMETELSVADNEHRRMLAESERLRGGGDEAAAQVAMLQASAAAETVKKLKGDIAAATLRAPMDGVILTKDLELRAGEYLQAGATFAEIAALDHWTLEMELDEKQVGRVEDKLGKGKPLNVAYYLYSQSASRLQTALQNRGQISASAFARDSHHVFLVTFPDLEFPQGLASVMRPGLTGRARVELGHRPMAAIYSERVWDWFQLKMIASISLGQ